VNDLPAIEQKLVTLFDRPELLWLALAVALGVGAFHAVAPGHGKTITAAYLAGSRAGYRHAAALGAIVAAMHTLSVLVLAVAWVGVSAVAERGTETVTAWMQLLSGVIVLTVGIVMVLRCLRSRGHSHDVAHEHGHEHQHSHGHPHTHALPTGRPGLVALGLSGGLLPSPSAFLVLVTGMLTGRSFAGILLVVAFGIGMAATLTLVGIATVWGRSALDSGTARWTGVRRLTAWMPAVAGAAVMGGGGLYLVRAAGALAS
jgi:nickel/cobalt exporter